MTKIFNKLNYSYIFWFYFALITLLTREYYLDEKVLLFNIFPTKIESLFSIIYILFLIYTLFIFVMILKKSKTAKNRFFSFLGNTIVILHLVYTTTEAYNLINLTMLKDYHIKNQINTLKQSLPLDINSFTKLVDINVKDHQINYVYQLSKDKHSFEMLDLRNFKNGVQESLCNEDYSVGVLKYDYNLNYKYIDKNKEEIAQINTTKEDCGEGIYDLDYIKLILMDKKI